jgi:hypothetical protein
VQRMLIAATHNADRHCSTKHHDSLSEKVGGENPYSMIKCVLRYNSSFNNLPSAVKCIYMGTRIKWKPEFIRKYFRSRKYIVKINVKLPLTHENYLMLKRSDFRLHVTAVCCLGVGNALLISRA